MRFTKRFAGLALAAGMLLGVGTLSAAERIPAFAGRPAVRVEKTKLTHRPAKFHHEVRKVHRNLHRRVR